MNATTDLLQRVSYPPLPLSTTTTATAGELVTTFTAGIDGDEQLRARIAERRFDLAKPPPKPVPIFLINGKCVCTAGNLTAIIAQTKTGKTAFTGAAIAAAVAAHHGIQNCDTLGWTASAPGRKRLIHIDTEQSRFDHHAGIGRELRRAGVETVPDWLHSYCLTGFSPVELKATIRLLLQDAADDRVFAVIIDGVGDLVSSVNEVEESVATVTELRTLSISHNCPILCVIHDNEGKQTNGDGRGHLGKELMRKAESNLRLKKDAEITVVFSEKQRRAPILEKDGPRFSYDEKARMHLSCASIAKEKDAELREKLRDEAEAIFAEIGKDAARWGEMLDAIRKIHRVVKSTAEDRWRKLKKHRVIISDGRGAWTINPVTP